MDILSIDKYISGFKQKFKQFRLRYLTFGRSDYVTVSKKLGIFGLWLLEKSFKLVAIVAAGVVLSANGPFAEKLKTGFSSLSGVLRKLFEFPAEMDRMGTIIYDYNHLTVAQFNSQYGSEAIDSLLWNLNAGIDYLILVYQNLTNQPISTLVACALAFGTFWILSRVLRFYRQKGRGTWLVRLERRLGEKIFKLNRFGSAGTGMEGQKSSISVGSKANGKSNINKYKRRRLRISPVATEIASNSKKSDSGSKVDGYLSKAKSNSVSPSKNSSGGPSKKSVDSLAKKKKIARKIAQLKNKPKSDNPALFREKINEGKKDKEPVINPTDTVLAMKPKPASPDLHSGYELKESNGKTVYDVENSDRESKTVQPDSIGQEDKGVIEAETSMQEMKMESAGTEIETGEDLNKQNNQEEEQTAKTTDIPSASIINHGDLDESEEKIQAESSIHEQEIETDTSSEETVSKVESPDTEDVEEMVPQDVNKEEISADVNSELTKTVDSEDQSTAEPGSLNQAFETEPENKNTDAPTVNGDSDNESGLPSGDIVEEPVSVSETPDSEVLENGQSLKSEDQTGDEIENQAPKAETGSDNADVIQMNGNGELDSVSDEIKEPEKQDPEPAPDSGQEPQVDKEQQDQKEEPREEKKKSGSPYNSTSTANIKSLQSAIRQARSS